jgi:hypothetical protein
VHRPPSCPFTAQLTPMFVQSPLCDDDSSAGHHCPHLCNMAWPPGKSRCVKEWAKADVFVR